MTDYVRAVIKYRGNLNYKKRYELKQPKVTVAAKLLS